MVFPDAPPDELVVLVAERLALLGEPMRIRLLCRLRRGEASVNELTAELGTTQQNVSKHLNVLHAGGLVSRRRDGTRRLYAVADPSVFALCEIVCDSLRQRVDGLDDVLAGANA